MRLLPILIIPLVLLSGALGLKTVQQCDADPDIVRDSELMNCYHIAAISDAHMGHSSRAISTCGNIWYKFGRQSPDPNSDIVKKSRMVSDACYYDIALIMRDPVPCSYIGGQGWAAGEDEVETSLYGEAVTKERCDKEVERLAAIAPEHYHDTANNLCSIVFVLPLLLFAVLRNP